MDVVDLGLRVKGVGFRVYCFGFGDIGCQRLQMKVLGSRPMFIF